MAGRGQRAHSTLGFHREPAGGREGSVADKGLGHSIAAVGEFIEARGGFWQEKVVGAGMRAASTGPNVGHARQPAAGFTYDSRQKNLNPGVARELSKPPRQGPPLTKATAATKPAFKVRQMEREERGKNRFRAPAIVEKITAEKQISNNPLLPPVLGLQWQRMGQKPRGGVELRHSRLAEALKRKTVFSHTEWDDFDISDLRADHFIRVPHSSGAAFFCPVNPEADLEEDPHQQHSITNLTLHDLCKLRLAFERADVDKSGELDQNEFVDAFLPVLGGVDEKSVHLLFMRIDANSDGGVSWEEFLSYVMSQDEGQLNIASEASRQFFNYPSFLDNALHIRGHKISPGGMLHLEEVDRYVSFSRKGEMLVWRPECLDTVSKIIHPREFETNLPFITQLIHVKKLAHSERLGLCSADKQVIFVDLLRETTKLSGRIKMEFSPLCMCPVRVLDQVGDIIDEMICFGDDQGMLHLYNMDLLCQNASRNLVAAAGATEMWSCKEAHVKSWKAHEPNAWVSKVEYFDDSRMIISAASDCQLVINDALKGSVKHDGFRHRGDISDFLWMKKLQLLASCGLERHINIWQIPVTAPVYKLEGHQAPIQQLAFGAGQLISIDANKAIMIWDVREMCSIQRLEGVKMHQEFPIGRMIYDHVKQGIVTCARKPLFWHIEERKVPSGHTTPISAAVYNPQFQTLVSADESAVVRVWNLNTGQAIIRFPDTHLDADAHPVKVTSVTFDGSGRRLITGAHDGSIKLWNFSTGQTLKEFVGFGRAEVTGLACMFMTPYEYVLATGWSRKVSLWIDPQSLAEDQESAKPTLQAQRHMEGPKEDVLCMACYPELLLLVTGSYDGDIIIWNVETGNPRAHLVLPGLASMKPEQKAVEAMQLAGKRQIEDVDLQSKPKPKTQKKDNIVVLLFTVSADGVIRIWSTDDTAELLYEMPLEKDTVEAGICALCVCENSKVLIAADNRGELYVYDIHGTMESAKNALPPASKPLVPPNLRTKFKAHAESIPVLLYINTRRLIVTGCIDCTICLWTIDGNKMGTFGEEDDWKLSAKSHDFTRDAEKAVFSETPSGAVESSSAFARARSRRQSVKSEGSLSHVKMGGSSKDSTAKNSMTVTPSQNTPLKEPVDSVSVSAFMTQLEEDIETQEGGGMVGDENWEDFLSSDAHSDSDDDETLDALAAERFSGRNSANSLSTSMQENLVLKEDIDAIIQRGMTLKGRGGGFFDGNDLGTYRRMLVRDIGDTHVPDSIQRKLLKMHKHGNAPTKAGSKRQDGFLEGDEDEEGEEDERSVASAKVTYP